MINFALLLKFFEQSQLDSITAEKLLATQPIIKIPDFKRYEHEIQENITALENDRHDLDKVAEAVKNNRLLGNIVALTFIPYMIIELRKIVAVMTVLQQVALTKGHLVLHYTQDHLEIHNEVQTGLNNVTKQT